MSLTLSFTTMCWNSQDFMTWVACFGSTPLLLFFFPSGSSSSESIPKNWINEHKFSIQKNPPKKQSLKRNGPYLRLRTALTGCSLFLTEWEMYFPVSPDWTRWESVMVCFVSKIYFKNFHCPCFYQNSLFIQSIKRKETTYFIYEKFKGTTPFQPVPE
jgi:hypothetical protein